MSLPGNCLKRKQVYRLISSRLLMQVPIFPFLFFLTQSVSIAWCNMNCSGSTDWVT
jgi:hypothetical protein